MRFRFYLSHSRKYGIYVHRIEWLCGVTKQSKKREIREIFARGRQGAGNEIIAFGKNGAFY
jgi:hypothetical protein